MLASASKNYIHWHKCFKSKKVVGSYILAHHDIKSSCQRNKTQSHNQNNEMMMDYNENYDKNALKWYALKSTVTHIPFHEAGVTSLTR